MVEAGEDPRFIARRLVILAAEDIGMADPRGLQIAVAAADAVAFIGMPEGRIPLARRRCTSRPRRSRTPPTSASIRRSPTSARGGSAACRSTSATRTTPVRSGSATAKGYQYAHDFPDAIATQQYLPDELAGTTYYAPTTNGYEAQIIERLDRIRARLREPGRE